MNILAGNLGIRVTDFSLADTYHNCPGVDICQELVDTANKLQLSPLHVTVACLSSSAWTIQVVLIGFAALFTFVIFLFPLGRLLPYYPIDLAQPV